MSRKDAPTFNLNLDGGHSDIYTGPQSAVLFEGVMSRRVVAHIFDLIALFFIISVLSIPFFVVGILTFGLLFFFYGLYVAAIALSYIALSLGGASGATPGMRAMQIEMRTLEGYRLSRSMAFINGFLFFASMAVATPLILLVGLFNPRGRLVHDILCGTVVVNTPRRIDEMLRT